MLSNNPTALQSFVQLFFPDESRHEQKNNTVGKEGKHNHLSPSDINPMN